MTKHFISAIVSGLFVASSAWAGPVSGDQSSEISKTVWAVAKLNGDRPEESHTRKIAFSSPQEFKLQIDCDYYKGRYQVEGDALRISTLTKVASDCDAEIKNDALFLNALLVVERYEVVNNGLKFLTSDGALVASLDPTSTFDVPSSQSKASKKHGKHQKAEKIQTAKAGKKGKKSKAMSKASAAKTGVAKSSAAKGGSSKKTSPKQGKQHKSK